MDANILCELVAKRISPEKFQFWGNDVHWMADDFNTSENRAVITEVIANYDVLAAAYELEQISVRKEQAYRTESDPIFVAYQALLTAGHADAESKRQEWMEKREEIQARFT